MAEHRRTAPEYRPNYSLIGNMPTTPPVAPEVVESINADVQHDLPVLVADAQKAARVDSRGIVAAVVHLTVLLVAAFGLKLDASQVAVLGSIVAAGLSYFVAVNPRKL
jgi:hypothetical protein